jgi:hypothetical protein
MKYILITHGSKDEDILHSVSIITEDEKFKKIEDSDKTVYFEGIKCLAVKYKEHLKKVDYTEDPDIVVLDRNSQTFNFYHDWYTYFLYLSDNDYIYKMYEEESNNKLALLKLKQYLSLGFKVVCLYNYLCSRIPGGIRSTSLKICTSTGIGKNTKLVKVQDFVEYLHQKTNPVVLTKENLESIEAMIKHGDNDSLLIALEMLANAKYSENQMRIGYLILIAVYKIKKNDLDKYLTHSNLGLLLAYYSWPNTSVKRRQRGRGYRVYLTGYLREIKTLFYHPEDKEVELLKEQLEEDWIW